MTAVDTGPETKLDYRAVDVDNHYYEPVDAFTRHLPKEFRSRGVQMVQDGKRTLAVFGGVVNHFIPNPRFDPIISPQVLVFGIVGLLVIGGAALLLGLL